MQVFCFKAGGGWMAAVLGERGLFALVLPQDSPAGAKGRLAALLGRKGLNFDPAAFLPAQDDICSEARALVWQVQRYFTGEEVVFSVRVDWSGYTPFQKMVLEEIRAIPYGQTRTYAQVAEAIGVLRGARAVGAAAAKNRTPLVVPCHRVVAAGGLLGGFSYGAGTKLRLLTVEGAAGALLGR